MSCRETTNLEELGEELLRLTAAFSERIAWHERRGCHGALAGPTPRVNTPAEGDDTVELEAEEATGLGQSELQRVRERLGDCTRCRLSQGRRNIVFGVGDPHAELMFVGEAPGRDEDLQGEPFVGAAGQLLTRMIAAMGLERSQVYIANIIKCRPPKNRDPLPDEIESCQPFLEQQINAIGPRILVALGSPAAKTLLCTTTGITRLRGRLHDYRGIPLMPTFHPAYLLRNPEAKRPTWEDLQLVMAEMDRLGLQRKPGP